MVMMFNMMPIKPVDIVDDGLFIFSGNLNVYSSSTWTCSADNMFQKTETFGPLSLYYYCKRVKAIPKSK